MEFIRRDTLTKFYGFRLKNRRREITTMKKMISSTLLAGVLLATSTSVFASENLLQANEEQLQVSEEQMVSPYAIVGGGFYRTSVGSEQNFSDSWELIEERGVGTEHYRALKFGFNKFAYNEDYAHTYYEYSSHKATVENDNGPFSKSGSKQSWARIEVKHAGTNITYRID